MYVEFCKVANQYGPFDLPILPYDRGAFGEVLSSESFDYHYGKHHQSYVNNLNDLMMVKYQNDISKHSLESIIQNPENHAIFNNAAQVWNHTFFWHSLTPIKTHPNVELLDRINLDFGSFDKLCEELKKAAVGLFGSGWAWLVCDGSILKIISTHNADCPIVSGLFPLVNLDVWEHAYYIDHRNNRIRYVDAVVTGYLNWEFAGENYKNAVNVVAQKPHIIL